MGVITIKGRPGAFRNVSSVCGSEASRQPPWEAPGPPPATNRRLRTEEEGGVPPAGQAPTSHAHVSGAAYPVRLQPRQHRGTGAKCTCTSQVKARLRHALSASGVQERPQQAPRLPRLPVPTQRPRGRNARGRACPASHRPCPGSAPASGSPPRAQLGSLASPGSRSHPQGCGLQAGHELPVRFPDTFNNVRAILQSRAPV